MDWTRETFIIIIVKQEGGDRGSREILRYWCGAVSLFETRYSGGDGDSEMRRCNDDDDEEMKRKMRTSDSPARPGADDGEEDTK